MKINSVDRAIQILELLSEHPRGLRLTELSAMLDLHPSSLHHIISTLTPYEYISQDPETKKYSLGFRLLSLGRKVLESIDVRNIAKAHMEELNRKCNLAVHLSILKGDKVVYIDKINPGEGLSLVSYPGFSTEAYATSGGKVLLAGLSDEKLRYLYKDKELKTYGKRTITKFSDLMIELDKIRKQGYSIDDEEYYEGVRCVAAPIYAGNMLVASVSITGPTFDITIDRINSDLKEMVIACSQTISSKMRW